MVYQSFMGHWMMQVILLAMVIEPDEGHVSASSVTTTFDHIENNEFHAIIGQTIVLPCTVRNLKDKVVSWIRSHDLHILTSAGHKFSSDDRFTPAHQDSLPDFWGLQITNVKASDAGQYECQVNTDPKMSLAIKLIVSDQATFLPSKWVSRAFIHGPKEVYMAEGSPAVFTCEISSLSAGEGDAHAWFFATKPKVWWLKDDQQITDETKIHTEYRHADMVILSRIQLHPGVARQDAGLYTCMQPSTKPDTVRLIVVEENEISEAMQRDSPTGVNSSAKNYISNYFLVTFISILSMYQGNFIFCQG